jgi:hypothetical protein
MFLAQYFPSTLFQCTTFPLLYEHGWVGGGGGEVISINPHEIFPPNAIHLTIVDVVHPFLNTHLNPLRNAF